MVVTSPSAAANGAPLHPPSTVVVLLSQDDSVIETLPIELAHRDPEIEVQVVPTLQGLLSHTGRMRPDAMVIDAEGIGHDELTEVLQHGPGSRVPTIVLASGTSLDQEVKMLAAGATGFVARQEGFWERLGEEVWRTRRVVAMAGRGTETKQHYLNILEASSDGIFVLVRGVFRYLNSSFENAVGRTACELIDKTDLVSLLVPEQQQTVAEKLQHLEANEKSAELLAMSIQTPEGRRVFEVSCRSSVVDGQRAVVGVARDVTEVRRLQQEVERARRRTAHLERLRALGELAAGVAHDFNNALGTILGRLRIAKEKLNRREGISEELVVMERAANDAVATARRVQEFSRPSATITWQDVDLSRVAKDALAFVHSSVPPEINLVAQLDPTPTIRGSAAELREVLLNLLTNALDAVEPDGTVNLRTGEQEGRAMVTIEDDGCGMEPGVQDRIFEPFFSTKAQAGTGLGLSVSHWILRRHDARIELSTAPGQGTEFELSFTPFEPALARDLDSKKSELEVLVVDDDASVGDLVSDVLSDQGHSVEAVADARAGCAAIEAREFDLVITDLDLPDMSGWELARRVRRQNPQAMVGLITGWPLGISEVELRQRGVDFALNKPFTFESLTAAVRRTQNES